MMSFLRNNSECLSLFPNKNGFHSLFVVFSWFDMTIFIVKFVWVTSEEMVSLWRCSAEDTISASSCILIFVLHITWCGMYLIVSTSRLGSETRLSDKTSDWASGLLVLAVVSMINHKLSKWSINICIVYCIADKHFLHPKW